MKLVNKKIREPYFEAVISGAKKFELRKDEDDVQVGDYMLLREIKTKHREDVRPCADPRVEIIDDEHYYTGRECMTRIGYVLRDFDGLDDGYAIYSFDIVEVRDASLYNG